MAEPIEEKQDEEKEPTDIITYYLTRPKELEATEFEEGFTMKTVLGALFVGFIMMPGSIYIGLMLGGSMGPAAEWTTIILFNEVARRTFTTMRRQELYLIYYMAGGLMGLAGSGLAGGAFAGWIWNQYLVQSPAARNFGIADQIPRWVVPAADSPAIIHRTFLHPDWYNPKGLGVVLSPMFLLLIGAVLGRMQWIGLGYILFRSTSDIEKLPFPFAPIAAQGATALAEVSQEKESWRWPVFSIGAMIGMTYAFFYAAIPALTGAFLTQPLQLIPIPFIDFTPNAQGAFPTAMIALGSDLGGILSGFIIPYPIVIGGFITSMFTNFILSPTLYRIGQQPDGSNTVFPNWRQGMDIIQTNIAANLDVWLSWGIGVAVAIAVIGFGVMLKKVVASRGGSSARGFAEPPPGRGDFPLWLAAGLWLTAVAIGVIISHALVPRFPVWIIIVFAFLWSPINSYVSARLIGITGVGVGIPYLREATFILSGYKGIDIWFANIGLYDYGGTAQRFREIELTGTKFTSVIKAEVMLMFLITFCSFIFWSFFWRLGPIPSASYPFVQKMWPLQSTMQCLWMTATAAGGQENWLVAAIKSHFLTHRAPIVEVGFGVSMLIYILVVGVWKAPVMWFYGLVGGIGAPTTGAIPSFIGCMLGRYYFSKRFGVRRWYLYVPVLLAGYACGGGLMAMLAIALGIIFKAVRTLPY